MQAKDWYFFINENGESTEAFSIEQLSNFALTPNQLINRNNTGWKPVSEFPELHVFILQKPLPPTPIELKNNVVQSHSVSNLSSNNQISSNYGIKDFYNKLDKNRKLLIALILFSILVLLGFLYFRNSACEVQLRKKEKKLEQVKLELEEKRKQLSSCEKDLRSANNELSNVADFKILRGKAQKESDIKSAKAYVSTCYRKREDTKIEVDNINAQIKDLKTAIEELQEKCGDN